jgi:hypothetical protein
MTAKNRTTWIVLGVGAAALLLWYSKRRTGSLFGLFTGGLAGQGTAGSGTVNTSLTGSGGAPRTVLSGPAYQMTEAQRIQLRNSATGPQSRSACIFPMRWIDTQTAPYYGVCVTQSQFNQWTTGGQFTGEYQPTLDQLRQLRII